MSKTKSLNAEVLDVLGDKSKELVQSLESGKYTDIEDAVYEFVEDVTQTFYGEHEFSQRDINKFDKLARMLAKEYF